MTMGRIYNTGMCLSRKKSIFLRKNSEALFHQFENVASAYAFSCLYNRADAILKSVLKNISLYVASKYLEFDFAYAESLRTRLFSSTRLHTSSLGCPMYVFRVY